MHVQSLHVYPVKGARGIALERAELLRTGFRHDRRFMVVDEAGVFLSQRGHPRLALVDVAIGDGTLRVGPITLALAPESGSRERRRVRVWDDEVDALVVPGDVSTFLSAHLGVRCTLVYMPDDVVRAVDPVYARAGDRVGFADAFPVLVATQASLDDLNARLAAPLPMNRFRPNIVLAGAEPWEEDRHPRVCIGEVTLRMPKRCARCEVTLVDQQTAERGKEPLRTLATFRSEENKVYFAQNAIPDAEGTVRVGDAARFLDQT